MNHPAFQPKKLPIDPAKVVNAMQETSISDSTPLKIDAANEAREDAQQAS
jgi:hypothetical protein